MKLPAFEYVRPASLDEALGALVEGGDEAKVLAGGQSLLPLMAFRLAHPALLVDVGAVGGLGQVEEEADRLVIGAVCTHAAVEDSTLVRSVQPLLSEAVPWIGHRPIRVRGTVGGSLAHADPAAEIPLVAVVLEAGVEVASPRGTRVIPASAFFQGFLETAVGEDEIVIALHLPRAPAGSGSAFTELARRHGDFAMVSAAAQVVVGPDRTLTDVRLGLGAVGSRPVRLPEVEQLLTGATVDGPPGALVEAAVAGVPDLIEPPDDLHATARYRRTVATTLAARVLEAAVGRALADQEVLAR